MKRYILAVIAVFLAWSVLDFLIHGMFLKSTYEATASLWRPEAEMKMGLMSAVTLISSFCFVAVYSFLIEKKSMASGFKYGLLFGLGAGTGMGFGTYSYMPITLFLASSWFVGTLIEITLGGTILGLIYREPVSA